VSPAGICWDFSVFGFGHTGAPLFEAFGLRTDQQRGQVPKRVGQI